jgi:hypothetical protein
MKEPCVTNRLGAFGRQRKIRTRQSTRLKAKKQKQNAGLVNLCLVCGREMPVLARRFDTSQANLRAAERACPGVCGYWHVARLPRRPCSTPPKASLPSSPIAASNAASSDPSTTSRTPSIAELLRRRLFRVPPQLMLTGDLRRRGVDR